MKVVLLTDVRKIGQKGEVKEVNDGHAQNFLIPQGLAKPATDASAKAVAAKKAAKLESAEKKIEALAETLRKINKKSITISAKANEKGHLFQQIHESQVVEALAAQLGENVDASFIKIENPIKEIGSHEIVLDGAGEKARLEVVVE